MLFGLFLPCLSGPESWPLNLSMIPSEKNLTYSNPEGTNEKKLNVTRKLKAGHRKNQEREIVKKNKREEEFQKKKTVIFQLVDNLHHFFPDLFTKLEAIEDFRKMPLYKISEVIFAGITLHIFKEGSRNGFNNLRIDRNFLKNYARAFKMRLPHLDTVDIAMRNIPNEVLEKLKTHLVRCLIEKKIFYKYRLLGKFFNASIDATGTKTIEEANIKHFPNAVFKIYNEGKENEKKVYFIYVLEAKLVCQNGFCISLGSEWIENPGEKFIKQDCELKAFTRLAKKLKENYPRLPICIVGDGLYPNQNVFEICKKNKWEWIFTFKDGNLPSVWDEVDKRQEDLNKNKIEQVVPILEKNKKNNIIASKNHEFYCWINSINYMGHKVNWARVTICNKDGEVIHEFVYLSSFEFTSGNLIEIVGHGRMRFKIENEGFNTQKNLGYALKHKFSETSELAMKNYHTCIQIAHMINQLFELQVLVKERIKGRETICSLWRFIKSYFSLLEIACGELKEYIQTKRQIKFD